MTHFIISVVYRNGPYPTYRQAAFLTETLAPVRFEVLRAALLKIQVSSGYTVLLGKFIDPSKDRRASVFRIRLPSTM